MYTLGIKGALPKNKKKLTNVPKLRSFNYRILQRGPTTAVQLFKWGLEENDRCQFCGIEIET